MDYVEIEKNGGQQLEAYTGFAAVYDIFMDNVPYEESFGFGLWHRNNDGEAGGLWI